MMIGPSDLVSNDRPEECRRVSSLQGAVKVEGRPPVLQVAGAAEDGASRVRGADAQSRGTIPSAVDGPARGAVGTIVRWLSASGGA